MSVETPICAFHHLSTFDLNLINRIHAIIKMLLYCLQFTKKMTVTLSSAGAGMNSSFIHTVDFLRALGVPENNSIQVRMRLVHIRYFISTRSDLRYLKIQLNLEGSLLRDLICYCICNRLTVFF